MTRSSHQNPEGKGRGGGGGVVGWGRSSLCIASSLFKTQHVLSGDIRNCLCTSLSLWIHMQR